MTALQCQTCKSVWLPAHADEPMIPTDSPGCLRCDGDLEPMTPDQVRVHIDSLGER